MTTKTIQKDEDVVKSLKTSSKREFDTKVRLEDKFRFNASDLANSYSGNPELWSLWYSQLLDEMFEGVENLLQTPITVEDATLDDAVQEFVNGFDKLANMASKRTDDDTTPLVKNRKKIAEFRNSENGEITLIIRIMGGECEIQCVNGFITEQNINFEVSENKADCVEESALREHSNEVIEFFNSYSPYRRRPQNKYKRTLSVSIKKNTETSHVTVGVDEVRTRSYSLSERLLSSLGQDFSSQSYESF